jgi:xylulokinase
MGFYLGFDIGTSSIKATAIDREGTIQKTAVVPISMISPKPGYFEIDTSNQWLRGFLTALQSLGTDLVSQAEGICISSVCASFVPIDTAGYPLRNAIMYGIDTRATAQIEWLNHTLSGESLSSISGSGFTAHSVIPKIMWLKEHEPDIYERTYYFVESSNVITSFLTEEYAWDKPTAAGAHLLDMKTEFYPEALFEKIGIEITKFPPLRSPLDILGKVTRRASKLTGLPIGIDVAVGACDINAEAFACGAFDPGSLLIVFGSTISTLFTMSEYKAIPGFLIGPSVLQNTYRLGGATSSGGRYLEWLNRTLEIDDASLVIDVSKPSSLLMVPFLDGARLPYQDPEYRVFWYGMTSSTTKSEYWLAAAEAMGCEIYDLISILSKTSQVPPFAYVSGGLSSNPVFLKIFSNVTGLVLKRFKNNNASFGDALMALSLTEGLERTRSILNSKKNGDTVEITEPDMSLFRSYEEKRKLYTLAVKWIKAIGVSNDRP